MTQPAGLYCRAIDMNIHSEVYQWWKRQNWAIKWNTEEKDGALPPSALMYVPTTFTSHHRLRKLPPTNCKQKIQFAIKDQHENRWSVLSFFLMQRKLKSRNVMAMWTYPSDEAPISTMKQSAAELYILRPCFLQAIHQPLNEHNNGRYNSITA